jgi:predicted phage tail component-like protein
MLKLNGVDIPSFVKVNKIGFSILPPIENNLLKVRGKAGLYNFGQDVGTRKITVSYTIIAEEINGVTAAGREFAQWLYHKEPVELVSSDEPDKHYLVLPDGETDVDETVNIGQGEITFVCTEPFAFGDEKTLQVTPEDENPFDVLNTGNTETYPVIKLKMKQDVPSISVVSEDKFVQIGEVDGVESVPKNTKPTRLNDGLANTSLWTSAVNVDGGIVAGSFSSNGYSFQVANSDYGTSATTWHGASAIRSLPNPISDFEVTMVVGMDENHMNQVGRIEAYLLDANNEQFGKMALKETWDKGTSRWWEARAGKLSGGHLFANENRRGGTWQGKGTHLLLKIARTGRKWWAWIGQWSAKDNDYRSRLDAEWYDHKGIATNKLAKIQLHIGACKNFAPVNNMYISDLKVYERLTLSAGQVPIVAEVDDEITIDSSKGIVLKNGIPFYEGLNPASNFISLKKGYNGISVVPAVADVTVTYKERWL